MTTGGVELSNEADATEAIQRRMAAMVKQMQASIQVVGGAVACVSGHGWRRCPSRFVLGP